MSAVEIPSSLRRAWASELEIEKAEARALAERDKRSAAKIEQARETLAEHPIEQLEKLYADYIEAMRVLVSVADALAYYGPPLRQAHRILADAGEVTASAPAPLSVRASSDHELRALRTRAWECTNGDL